jgi:hypothetical protein
LEAANSPFLGELGLLRLPWLKYTRDENPVKRAVMDSERIQCLAGELHSYRAIDLPLYERWSILATKFNKGRGGLDKNRTKRVGSRKGWKEGKEEEVPVPNNRPSEKYAGI